MQTFNYTPEELAAMPLEQLTAIKRKLAAKLKELRIVHVTEVQETLNGNPYFGITVQQGTSRKVYRNLWGKYDEEGTISWQNLSPEQAHAFMLLELDLSSNMRVETAEIEPREIRIDGVVRTDKDGNPLIVSSVTMVVMDGESLKQATKRCGFEPRSHSPQPPAGAFQYVGINGLE